jgi:pimeloyl-ACP methyl ester carboxylesterase
MRSPTVAPAKPTWRVASTLARPRYLGWRDDFRRAVSLLKGACPTVSIGQYRCACIAAAEPLKGDQTMVEYKTFALGDFALQTGVVLPDTKLVYAAVGRLNDAKDNVVLFPTWGSGTPDEAVGLMTGAGRALDPDKYFIVIPNHFGGGLSSSPSNCAPPFEKGRFPRVSAYDNVIAQRRLFVEAFGVDRLLLVAGYSMGAILAYHWAAHYPDAVRAIAPIAGSARTGHFNKVFLAGIRSAIMSDPDWNNGVLRGHAAPPRSAAVRARLRWLGIFRAVLPPAGIQDRFRVAVGGGFHRNLLGGLLHKMRCEQPARPDLDLAPQRRLGASALRRRFREGAGLDQGSRDPSTLGDRHVFPAGRQ